MKFKKFRYNLIIVGLVAIIGCFVALPLITGGASDVNQGIILEEEPAEEVENIEDFIPEDEESDEEEYSIFEDMSNVELLNYAIDKLYNGKGFYSTYTQEACNVTSVAGVGSVSVPQRCKGTITRSGKNSLQEYYYYSEYSGIKADELKRFYQFDYVNRDNGTFTQGKTSTYDYQKMTHDMSKGSKTTMSYEEGVSKFVLLYGDEFPIVTNAKKGDIITVINNGDSDYRTLEVKYNVNNLPKSVKDLFGITGQLQNINYKSLKIVYKINLNNGNMVSMKRVEQITAVVAGFPSELTTTTTQNFKSVDKEQTIIEP